MLKEAIAWHTLDADAVLKQLAVDVKRGISTQEIEKRRLRYGENRLKQKKSESALKLFLLQFHQPLVYILIVACVVMGMLQEFLDASVIVVVIVINAVIGYIQEAKARQAIEALSKLSINKITILRNGEKYLLDAKELVVGDIVLLYSGDKVPADIKLCMSKELRVDESSLTGESVSESKHVGMDASDTPLADRLSMLYASTLITHGFAQGVVVEVGDATQIGKINTLIATAQILQTPLTQKLAHFSKRMLYSIVAISFITFGLGLWHDEPLVETFMASVALAVGIIPEGLPAVMTIILAIGVVKMARKNAIIRRLPAVETLGSTTVICSDKTGTLTQNAMSVTQIYVDNHSFSLSGSGYDPKGDVLDEGKALVPKEKSALYETLYCGLLCNTALHHQIQGTYSIEGDPTEGALIVSAKKGGITEVMAQQSTLVDTLHFESERQYMASLYQSAEGFVVYMKGSVEKILERCDWAMGMEGEKRAIDKALIVHYAETMATSGLRILAFAKLCLSENMEVLEHQHLEKGLIFLGLQGMMDPPRVGVNEAVQRCYEAGVEVKMITGDHGVTALAIAKAIGIRVNAHTPFLTGKEMDVYTDAQLLNIIQEVNVFARIAPEQKLRLVKALQAHDEIVAMTGDGVNDAPALRQANIGIAMGISGTEVAKESADMILADDNFLSIKDAIEEGRVVYDNLIKFITWILPTNVGEGLVIIVSIGFGMSLPLLPLQILWINMLSDSALGIMLAYEPKEKALMHNPPRSPQTPIMSQALLFRVLLVGCLLFIHAFGAFFYTLSLGVDEMVARTLVINIFVFGEMLYLFNCRSFHYSVFKIGFLSNPYLLYAMVVVGGLQLFLTYHPWMNRLFDTAPLGWFEWGIVSCSSLLIYGVVEVEKYVTCKKNQGCHVAS